MLAIDIIDSGSEKGPALYIWQLSVSLVHEQFLCYVQCGVVITRPTVTLILTIGTPYLAREGKICGVFCE